MDKTCEVMKVEKIVCDETWIFADTEDNHVVIEDLGDSFLIKVISPIIL